MRDNPRLLLVDDEAVFREVMAKELKRRGFFVESSSKGEDALSALDAGIFDVVLLDLHMSGMDGLQVLRRIRESDIGVEVVMLTGHGAIPEAVEAMRVGAFDFLTKPCEVDVVEATCRRALERKSLLRENRVLRREVAPPERGAISIQGESEAIVALRRTMELAAQSDAAILVLGETGVGKELVARSLHATSPRSGRPFVAVNCAGLTGSLLESELFGHEKGAFTGANAARAGLFEAADGGSLFLDEIAEMAPNLQASLLRAVQFGEIRRIGANHPRKVDVRILAATHRDLSEEIRRGAFREDLYYRLQGFVFQVPPLRERKADIGLLAQEFLANRRYRIGKSPKRLSSGGLKALQSYSWPGNVRELQNVIERLCLLSDRDAISEDEVLAALFLKQGTSTAAKMPDSLEEMERSHIANILAECQGRKPEAAARLGISLKTLYNKLERFRI